MIAYACAARVLAAGANTIVLPPVRAARKPGSLDKRAEPGKPSGPVAETLAPVAVAAYYTRVAFPPQVLARYNQTVADKLYRARHHLPLLAGSWAQSSPVGVERPVASIAPNRLRLARTRQTPDETGSALDRARLT